MSPSTQAARVLLQALADLGLREVVLAPGSRSAPLAYALADAAAADGTGGVPHLDLHVRVDERSAAFLALGLAKGARAAGHDRPVAVVTTSGTAVANLHPAVLEAHHSGLPLLLLTADRPHELRGTGANQTTEQVGLLAPAVRLTIDVPAPTGRDGEARDLRHLASRAVAAATGARTGDPGPVHLDLAFRDPLVPGDEPWPTRSREGLTEVARRGSTVLPTGASSHGAGASVAALVTVADRGAPADGVRTVVVAGDGAGVVAQQVAEANGWPLLAEPSSGARGGTHAIAAYRLLLAEPDLGGAVERVVVLGRPTLSRPVQTLLARPDVVSLVIVPDGAAWPDAARNATQVLAEVPPNLLTGNLGAGTPAAGERSAAPGAADGGWLAAWRSAGRAADRAIGELLAAEPVLTGPAVAAAVARATGPDRRGTGQAGTGPDDVDVLVVGSSNPVRDVDLTAVWPEGAPLVLANRGVAGIDGTLSTATGVALALGRPVRALVGDLTFLHDLNGLLVGPLERRPDLQVVVANDDGGSIFATLEHGAHGTSAAHGSRPGTEPAEAARAAVVERLFGTPHGADLAALCTGYGVRHTLVEDLPGLERALAEPVEGVSVIEARVDRAGRRDLTERIAVAVTERHRRR